TMDGDARRLPRRVGTSETAWLDSAEADSLLNRRSASHCSHAGTGEAGGVPAARGQRDSQWQGISLCRSVGGGKNNHLPLGATRRQTLDRRDFVRAKPE